jgi:hypothetical protein
MKVEPEVVVDIGKVGPVASVLEACGVWRRGFIAPTCTASG